MNKDNPLSHAVSSLNASCDALWVLEHISEGFIQLDNSYCYTYANRQIERFTGRAASSLIGKYIWEEFPDAVGSKTHQAIVRAMEECVEVRNGDYYPSADFWQENRVYPVPGGVAIFITDITARKKNDILLQETAAISQRTSRQLQKEQAFANTVAENIPGYLAYWSKGLVCEYFNKKEKTPWMRGTGSPVGYTMQELLGGPFVESVWPQVVLALQGTASQFEREVTLPGGGTGYVLLQYVPRFDGETVDGFYALVTNITELKKAQLAVETEQHNKNTIINASSDQIWSIDRDCRLTTANNVFLATLAAVTGSPVNKGDDMLGIQGLPPGISARWASLYARALGGESFSEEIYYAGNSRHAPVWIEYTFNPIIQKGEVAGAACNGRDITPRKNAATALEQANQHLSLILNTVTDVIYVLSVEPGRRFRLLLTNRVLAIHAVSKEQVTGLFIDQFMPRERLVVLEQKIAEAISSRTTVQWEQQFVAGDTCSLAYKTSHLSLTRPVPVRKSSAPSLILPLSGRRNKYGLPWPRPNGLHRKGLTPAFAKSRITSMRWTRPAS